MALYNLTYKLLPDSDKNKISFNGNYRIFTIDEPIERCKNIYEIVEDIELGSASEPYINRYIRYSYDKLNWSLWYDFDPIQDSPEDIGMSIIYGLEFDIDKPLYLEFKYEYNNTDLSELTVPISVIEIKVRVKIQALVAPLSVLTPAVKCSAEQCPVIVFDKNPTFNPYDVGPLPGLYKELSFYTNKLFGLDTVYFKTNPDLESGDYIFKEWTLYKTTAMKCIKMLVQDNNFNEQKIMFEDTGIGYETPFELEIDKRYFESIFGLGVEPRKRDFLYFPMLNRMFEVIGVLTVKTLMAIPMYYKLQVKIFKRNIDYLMQPEHREFLDNVLLDSEKLFEKQIKEDTKDATMGDQYKPITKYADETRLTISSDLSVRPLDYFFNYASLIENYYSLAGINESQMAVTYKIKPVLNNTDTQNISFTCLASFSITGSATILHGKRHDNSTSEGLLIRTNYNSTTKRLTLNTDINGTILSNTFNNIEPTKWYGIINIISSEFKQVGFFVYAINEEEVYPQNHTGFTLLGTKIFNVTNNMLFDIPDNYRIMGGYVSLANIRLFNKTLKKEEHEFILSQLFIKDESILYFIDNNRPRLNTPYIKRNK